MIGMPSLDAVRRALASHRPRSLTGEEDVPRAAVAAIVRARRGGPELLFIHRAQDPRDPWSGHMAFPGGRVDDGDRGPLEAAVRETREEIGVDLDAEGRLLGRLSDVPAVGRGRRLPLVIVPFVFELGGEPEISPNHEVADVVWTPLAFLLDPANRSEIEWEHGGGAVTLPCYRYQGRVVWGLTFAMVDELLEAIAGR